MNWEEYFLGIAEQVKLKSKDQNTQIGAVIVGEDNEILSTGYNSFPRGLDDNKIERQERPEKYHFMVHAEANAIVNAARVGTPTKDGRIYLTCGVPCSDCAKLIINCGIKEVVCKNVQDDVKGDIWIESKKKTLEMFNSFISASNYFKIPLTTFKRKLKKDKNFMGYKWEIQRF